MRRRIAKKILKEIRFRPWAYSLNHKRGNAQWDRAFRKMRRFLHIAESGWKLP